MLARAELVGIASFILSGYMTPKPYTGIIRPSRNRPLPPISVEDHVCCSGSNALPPPWACDKELLNHIHLDIAISVRPLQHSTYSHVRKSCASHSQTTYKIDRSDIEALGFGIDA